MNGRFFIFGLGFSGRVIARLLRSSGFDVLGSSRSGAPLDVPGVKHCTFDRDHLIAPEDLRGITHVLSSVPPDHAGDPVLDVLGEALCAAQPAWVGYLSTTGVYGDCGGAWVDETAPVNPGLERSKRRVAAERQWLSSGLPVHIFRLAGIYGPGRSAIDTVLRGEPKRIVKAGQVFSRIHVDDIAQTIAASIKRPNPGAVYNVCDDDCAPPQDVIAFACTLLGRDAPPEIGWEDAQASLSPMARSFYADNKRVRNDRIKTELGVQLKYPSYRDGLAAIRTGLNA